MRAVLAGALVVLSAVMVLLPSHRAGAADAVASANLLDEIDGLVRRHYYDPKQLERVNWAAAVAKTQRAVGLRGDPMTRMDTVNGLLSTLKTSHTNYYPREDPAYWQMAGIFEPVITRMCSEERRPPLPVTVMEIGVFWKRVGSKWFVGGVYAGGPAEAAGLKVGDEVLRADGNPFSPVNAFAGKAGSKVSLEVRRHRDGPVTSLALVAQAAKPHEALRQATENSWRILNRGATRIAYLRLWSWTSVEIQQTVLQAITKSNQVPVDAFILDLRDGWGGASPHYLTIFDHDVPVLNALDRDGKASTYDAQIRKPAVLLINRGTRSGKEIIAYGAKKHHFAQLVGEQTAGAVIFGQPFCLSDGSLLYLAVSDAYVDGERLEASGVRPDIEVPFDMQYADGQDPQLERALDLLSRKPD